MAIVQHGGATLPFAKIISLLQKCGDQQLKANFLAQKTKSSGEPAKELKKFRDDILAMEKLGRDSAA